MIEEDHAEFSSMLSTDSSPVSLQQQCLSCHQLQPMLRVTSLAQVLLSYKHKTTTLLAISGDFNITFLSATLPKGLFWKTTDWDELWDPHGDDINDMTECWVSNNTRTGSCFPSNIPGSSGALFFLVEELFQVTELGCCVCSSATVALMTSQAVSAPADVNCIYNNTGELSQ